MRYIMPQKKEQQLKTVDDPAVTEATLPSRVQNKKLSETDVNAADVDGVLTHVYEIIGFTDTTIVDAATPAHIDILATELLAVRDAKDLIEGRESALKQYATEIINYRIASSGDDPTEKSGFLVSPENGIKLSKEVSGGKLSVDIDMLAKVLDEQQFKSVVNHVHTETVTTYPDGTVNRESTTTLQLNEEALEKQVAAGAIGMEQVVKAAIPGKTRTALYVRKLK